MKLAVVDSQHKNDAVVAALKIAGMDDALIDYTWQQRRLVSAGGCVTLPTG